MLKRLTDWWNRPPAKDRILDALTRDWQRGLDVSRKAKVMAAFYVHIYALEAAGRVESKWEEGPPDPVRGGHRRRLYRLAS